MYAHNLNLVLKHFAVMWALTVIGLFIGMFLPSYIVIPLSILNLILLFTVIFVRNIQFASGILYAIPFFTGMMLFWIGQLFINLLGAALLLSVFLGTAVIFILLAILGLKIPRDLADWGMYLTATLIVVIVFSILFIFIPISNTVALILSAICVLLFALFTVYDFNLIRHHYVREHEVVFMALSLYLNFVNIFIHLLELVWRLKE